MLAGYLDTDRNAALLHLDLLLGEVDRSTETISTHDRRWRLESSRYAHLNAGIIAADFFAAQAFRHKSEPRAEAAAAHRIGGLEQA